MANTKSAKKSIKINLRNASQNKFYKTRIKTTEKKIFKAIEESISNSNISDTEKKKDLVSFLSAYFKRLDLAVKKNIIHKNKAARKKSKILNKFNKLGQ